MLKKLIELMGGRGAVVAPTTEQQAAPAAPNAPLEILVPDGAQPHEQPKLAGRTMSFLVAAAEDVNTIEYSEGRAVSNNSDLRQFLTVVAGAKRMDELIAHCTAVMYLPKMEGALGELACIQGGNLYSFSVYQRSANPNFKWEIHRRVRSVQVEPYGPNNSFKPAPDSAA